MPRESNAARDAEIVRLWLGDHDPDTPRLSMRELADRYQMSLARVHQIIGLAVPIDDPRRHRPGVQRQRARKGKPGAPEAINVRVTAAQYARLATAADAEGLPLGTYLRRAGLIAARRTAAQDGAKKSEESA